MRIIADAKWLQMAALAGLSVLLAGCPGGGTSSTATPSAASAGGSSLGAPPATTAAALAITGTPATTATAGQSYHFQPSVSGGSGTNVTYSVSNLPSWARFNTASGAVSGTPSASQTGSYANITIKVSKGGSTVSLAPFTVSVITGGTGAATLSWTAPALNTNGSILSDLAGYHIYYGTSASALSQEADVAGAAATSYTVSGLNTGTYYFAVTAYSSQGTESMPSPTVSKTI